MVSDHLYGIGHQIFGGEPLLNIIGGDPRRKVAKENGKAHSVNSGYSVGWICGTSRAGFRSDRNLIVPECSRRLQTKIFGFRELFGKLYNRRAGDRRTMQTTLENALVTQEGPVAVITLNRPERRN